MHLKESAYNFIYDDLGKDQIVFYNSRTGALAVVHEDQYKQYKGFQEKGKEIEDLSKQDCLTQNLVEQSRSFMIINGPCRIPDFQPFVQPTVPFHGISLQMFEWWHTQRCRSRTKRRYIRIA